MQFQQNGLKKMERNSPLKTSGKNLIHKKLSREERNQQVFAKKKQSKGKSNRPSSGGRTSFPFKTIHGIPLVEMDYTVPPMSDRKNKRSEFKDVKREFLKFMVEKHSDQLTELGFTKEELDYIRTAKEDTEQKEGRGLCPKRYNVHHKLPIHGGGQNEFSNFIIMPIDKHDDLHHKVIDPQIENIREGETRRILVPWSDRGAFISTAKIPGFDKSQDYEAFESGRRKVSQNGKAEERKISPSMEGELDDDFPAKPSLSAIVHKRNGRS